MIQRLGAAAVGLAILLPAIIWGGSAAVEIIVPVAMVVCVFEYGSMAFPDDRWAAGGWIGACIALVCSGVLYFPAVGLAVPAALVIVGTLTLGTLFPGP